MVKIGNYIIPFDEVSYIKLVGSSGCVVTLKTGGILSIVDVSDEEINNLKNMCRWFTSSVRTVYKKEEEK